MDVRIWIIILVLAIIFELITYGLVSIWFIPSIILTIILKSFGLNNLYIELLIVLITSSILLIFTRPIAVKLLKPKNIKTNFDRILDMEGKIIKEVKLNDFGIIVPKIIKNLANMDYVLIDNEYIVVYEFLNGKSIRFNGIIPREVIYKIAIELRKMHGALNINIGFKEINFDINLKRKSVLHFDLTKDNILYNDGDILFIDFDDAKYGESVIDISILIALFFVSSKTGVDLDGIRYFVDSYYGDDVDLKTKESCFIKQCALKWIDYTLENNEFESSLIENFELKKKLIKEYL